MEWTRGQFNVELALMGGRFLISVMYADGGGYNAYIAGVKVGGSPYPSEKDAQRAGMARARRLLVEALEDLDSTEEPQ